MDSARENMAAVPTRGASQSAFSRPVENANCPTVADCPVTSHITSHRRPSPTPFIAGVATTQSSTRFARAGSVRRLRLSDGGRRKSRRFVDLKKWKSKRMKRLRIPPETDARGIPPTGAAETPTGLDYSHDTLAG